MFNGIEKIFKESKEDIKIQKSNIHGMGVFAKTNISQDTQIGVGFIKINNTGDPDTDFKRTKLGRYINHSSNPNLKIMILDGADIEHSEYYFVAIRDITHGEELLVDYHEFDWEGKNININNDQIYLSGKPESVKKLTHEIRQKEERSVLKKVELDKGINISNFRVIMKGYKSVGLVGLKQIFDEKNLFNKDTNRRSGLCTVYIKPNHRSNNYATEGLKILAEEFVLDDILIKVKKDNIPANKAFQNDEYYYLIPEDIRIKLHKYNMLNENENLYIYHVTNIDDKEILFQESHDTLHMEAPEDEEETDDTPNTPVDNEEQLGDDTDIEEGGEPSGDSPDDEVVDTDNDPESDWGSTDDFEMDMEEIEEGDVDSKRKRFLNKCFQKMYDKYKTLIEGLNNIDTTKDRKEILNDLVEEYKEKIDMFIEYHVNNNDPITVQYQTFLEFRVIFIHLNNKLYTLKELITEEE